MYTPTVEQIGSDYVPREAQNYNLDDLELDDSPSEWELDRQAVFSWAKKCLSWGKIRPIPKELLTVNLRCSECSPPREQATYVSRYYLYCPRHMRARNRALSKLPKSPRKIRQQEEEERRAIEWRTNWAGIRGNLDLDDGL